ncbi:MAG: hypothetical protein J6N56_04810 [Bacteroidales bacterium]|nr:hypothetical protein [Bacteroidales bacterium]MBQ8032256.1 hypothetical protein [Butyrivibrio sp.]
MELLAIDNETNKLVLTLRTVLNKLKHRGLDQNAIDHLLKEESCGNITLERNGVLTLSVCKKVYLNPIERSLYLLFLRYEQGIAATDMWQYYDELCEIYSHQTIYCDPDRIEAAVDALCDDNRATLQTNISRIKKKVTDAVGKTAAEIYAIIRDKDGVYKITVPRNLVSLQT